MKNLLFILLMLCSLPIYSQQKNEMEKIQNLINSVKTKYAPDKRTALFDVNAKFENNQIILAGETNIKKAKSDLISLLNKDDIKTNDQINILPDSKLGKNIYGIIKISVATLRTKPREQAELSTQALLGCTIKILQKLRGWYLVQTPDKYIAWTQPSGFALADKEQIDNWSNTKKIIFTKEYGFAYSEKSSTSQPVSDLVVGDILKELEKDGSFIKVEYPDGRIGFVESKDCENYKKWLDSRNLTAENIIKTAERFLGTPYLWGGTSAKMLDCSGFTRTVFFLNGIYLPRDASQQVNVGIPVDTKNGFGNLQPGDLLFFGRKATDTTKERITHVGIYIGNDEFIHEAGQVHISSFDKTKENFSSYRLHQFVRAKRIITSVGKNGVIPLKDVNY